MSANVPGILGRQVELLYRNVRLGQLVSIVNASVLALIVRDSVNMAGLVVWWILAMLAAGIRIGLAARFLATPADLRLEQALVWRQRSLLTTAASGIVWAAGALLMMIGNSTSLQLFSAFVMAGMVAGAVPILAANRLVFRSYAWPVGLGAVIGSLGTDPMHVAMTIMILIFLIAVTRGADNFHDALHETFRLEHEKNILVGELDEARRRAERSDRGKTEFLANISHELRTPMHGILGFAELLGFEPLTADQRALLQPLRESADHLLLQINHLIDLSALEAGHTTLQPTPFAVNELFDHMLASHRPLAEAKGIALIDERPVDLPHVLVGDIAHLRQIFKHLVGNAIKFTDRGSVHISARPVNQAGHSQTVEFCITDTGPGIAPDKLALLNGLFVQADGSSIRRHGGIGIGLPITRKLIELMGGQLTISSAPGAGSRFCFQLPFALPEEETRTADQSP